jgi:bifunctional DNA-binding transcriptional regulator/antitoxin component of YhaV-PrlF toxin-antitoxin module
MDWHTKINAARRPAPTRVSRNGQIVLPVQTRRAAGIEAGDLVVAVPVAPGAVMVEKVKGGGKAGLRSQHEDAANPLRGIWGSDPDAWLEEIRGAWGTRKAS